MKKKQQNKTKQKRNDFKNRKNIFINLREKKKKKNEGMEPKQKQYPFVDVTGDRSKIRCCKEQYCIGTWNVRSMNQGKLEVVRQEMARANIDILGISEINGLEWVNLTQMAIISTTVGRNPLEAME